MTHAAFTLDPTVDESMDDIRTVLDAYEFADNALPELRLATAEDMDGIRNALSTMLVDSAEPQNEPEMADLPIHELWGSVRSSRVLNAPPANAYYEEMMAAFRAGVRGEQDHDGEEDVLPEPSRFDSDGMYIYIETTAACSE